MAERIDLNQADRDELASLPEIDDEIAQRIVEYRETVRPFSDVSELSAVDGISEETLQAIGDRLTVSAMVEDPPAEEPEMEPEDESTPEEEGVPETEPDNPPVDADKKNGPVWAVFLSIEPVTCSDSWDHHLRQEAPR